MAYNVVDRAELLNTNFLTCVREERFPRANHVVSLADAGLSQELLLQLFESQLQSRLLDLKARELKRKNIGFYTIASCGHEANAAVAPAFSPKDMTFLHYRSGAFMLQRAKAMPAVNMVRDILCSLMASSKDSIAGGRHKVFGSVPLLVPPQTSTIASHLPKAIGAAASIMRAQLHHLDSVLARDSVVLCSFGDATINHSTAQGAFNLVQWIAQMHYPLPIVLLCEDNGWGISVKTPTDWVRSQMKCLPYWRYLQADGLQLSNVHQIAQEAARIARKERIPVFLHLKMIRLLGHAGSDVELQYRSEKDIAATEAQDPLLHTARFLLEQRFLTAEDIITQYQKIKAQIDEEASRLIPARKIHSAKEVMASIVPKKIRQKNYKRPSDAQRKAVFAEEYAKLATPLNLAQQINAALTDILLQYPNTIIFGEDVAKKGGVYQVTRKLQQRFGMSRVFDSLLDEQSILGYAMGHAHNGFIPIPEIQYLAYLHNAEDQIRSEAATLSFFSKGQFTNPMVVRIASFAYQKGFGGHFHNDNSFAVLRDIPGIVIACPANGPDAAKMLRCCVDLAYTQRRVVFFLEPIALYMQKDLHKTNDRQWLFPYPSLKEHIKLGEIGVYGDSRELAIITYGNGYYLAEQARKILWEQDQLKIKIIDLRWLAPLNETAILAAVKDCNHILIVDECRKTGSISEQLVTLLVEQLSPLPKIKRLTAADTFIPLGTSWRYVLPSRDQIVKQVRELLTH